ncbi:hypothetical protein B7Y94_05555 [Candidatus Saccharibacteria bacterium 32-49-12]|nr:MAG: hypothetical protein B7Y94_05555 [Candidatus Saccharibacteria bacterium 32-49-12]
MTVHVSFQQTGELVAPGTAKTLFNAAVNVLRKRHPKNELWNVHTEDWYTAIVRDVEVTTSKRRILVGLPVHEKSEGIGREVLCRMMQASLSVAPNKQLQAIKDRIALVTTFLAIGRSGEVGFTSYNLSKWNSIYECINLEWPNLKRSEQQPLSFFPDVDCMEIDFYHAFGCYLAVGGDSSSVSSMDAESWIFPFLRANAAAKVTEAVKRFVGKVPGVPSGATGTCLRVGGAIEATMRAGVVAAVHRGGWEYPVASVTTMLEYMVQSPETLALAGKALAGWPEPRHFVSPPRCDNVTNTLTPAESIRFGNCISALFSNARCDLLHHLRPFAFTMFASLLMYLGSFIQKYGDKHIVIVNLVTTADRFQFSKATLIHWGQLIQQDWKDRNTNALAGTVDWRRKVEDLEATVQKLTHQNDALTTQLGRIEANQEQLLSAVLQLHQGCSAPPVPTSAPTCSTPDIAADVSDTTSTILTTTITITPELTTIVPDTTNTTLTATTTTPNLSPTICPQRVCSTPAEATPSKKRPRTSFLPQAPTVVRYTCKTSALDIAALYHAAFTVGTVVDHIDKRERQRVHAVVKNAATLLRTSTESRLLDISRRLQTAPVSTTSSAWEGWNRIHTQASVELKDIVMKLMQPDVKVGDAAYKPTVCAVGSRLLKQGV